MYCVEAHYARDAPTWVQSDCFYIGLSVILKQARVVLKKKHTQSGAQTVELPFAQESKDVIFHQVDKNTEKQNV